VQCQCHVSVTNLELPLLWLNTYCFLAHDIGDDVHSIADSIPGEQQLPYTSHVAGFENPRTRQIEPQQNWIARLFHVKPAMKYICFSISKRQARREIATLLREWKRYGTKEIVVDKERNIVFGRVGAKNCEFSIIYKILTFCI
jgi:serine/threonine-protein kinase HSL1 (negative regulator of Swe1 kinase)